VTTKREDDLDYLLAFVDQAAISGNALLLRAADRHMSATHRGGGACPRTSQDVAAYLDAIGEVTQAVA
jgi:hypothetical protein